MNATNQLYVDKVCKNAYTDSTVLAQINEQAKNNFLNILANNIILNQDYILKENLLDVKLAQKNELPTSLIDRLKLTSNRLKILSDSLQHIKSLPDPVGEITHGHLRPNGLKVHQIRVPLGVIMVVFESRPNVTIDITALAVKSGNAAILRGGKEAFHSNQVFGKIIKSSLIEAKLPENSVQIVDRQDREVVKIFLRKNDLIDIVIPRGGEKLIKMVSETSLIPVIKHDLGLCHLFLDADAPKKMAVEITENSKVQRPGVCNAIETLLVHKNFPYLSEVFSALEQKGVELRLDKKLKNKFPKYPLAEENDWKTEYLSLTLSVHEVAEIKEAVKWINHYGSHHTEVIVTQSLSSANYFSQRVDASAVIVNASSRFNDGFMLGMGAEIGISTQKLHVRGPMGLKDLTCLKYQIQGHGQIRY